MCGSIPAPTCCASARSRRGQDSTTDTSRVSVPAPPGTATLVMGQPFYARRLGGPNSEEPADGRSAVPPHRTADRPRRRRRWRPTRSPPNCSIAAARCSPAGCRLNRRQGLRAVGPRGTGPGAARGGRLPAAPLVEAREETDRDAGAVRDHSLIGSWGLGTGDWGLGIGD
ncbi:MAG: hypothetical protein MZV64_15280 [Ignavibacteriales bacterium]|nr:hypothetical protein [Ignavibacteriales bacterium]